MTREEILHDPELAPYVRRYFFERLTAGLMDRGEALAMARRLDIDLEAGGYAVALFTLPPPPRAAADYLSDPAAAVRSGLMAHFLKYAEYVSIPWEATVSAVLIKGNEGDMPSLIRRCVNEVRDQYAAASLADWHIAVSAPVRRLEDLPRCWEEASRLWAMRYIHPEQHVFLPARAVDTAGGEEAAPENTTETDGQAETGGALDRALAYGQEHISDPDLSLGGAAAHAGVTAGYLSALFRRELDTTFTAWVTARRMERARELLAETDLPVGQAAREAGFRDARYFSTLFRKTQGCTPTQFRERNYNV